MLSGPLRNKATYSPPLALTANSHGRNYPLRFQLTHKHLQLLHRAMLAIRHTYTQQWHRAQPPPQGHKRLQPQNSTCSHSPTALNCTMPYYKCTENLTSKAHEHMYRELIQSDQRGDVYNTETSEDQTYLLPNPPKCQSPKFDHQHHDGSHSFDITHWRQS